MISMLDRLGFGPKRVETELNDGRTRIDVTPPSYMGLPTQSVTLTENQMQRYRIWQRGSLLIQDAFPDLSVEDREILQSGIGSADFDRMFRDDQD